MPAGKSPLFRVSGSSFRRIQRKLDRLPREVEQELKKQGLVKAVEPILAKARTANFGFRDRTGKLRLSIRAGRPKNSKFGVQIPVIAGRAEGSNVDYAGLLEFGTKFFLPYEFLRPALHQSGVAAQVILQEELTMILQRLRGV